MFTKLLRLFLYFVFFGCVIWGAVLIGGPSVLKFIVNKTFGDSVTLYNLRITPKLNILVSRIEISEFKYQDRFIDGSIRSLDTKMTGLFNLKPIITVSTGQIRLDEVVDIDKVGAIFSFPEISLSSKANFDLELTEIMSHDIFSSEYLVARGHIDLRSRVLIDAKIKARNVSSLNELEFTSSSITGSLSNWHVLKDDVFPPNSLNLDFHKLKFPTRKIYVENATLSGGLADDRYNVIVRSDALTSENYYNASKVSVHLTAKRPSVGNIEEVKLNASSVSLPRSRFLESGEVMGLSIDLIKKNNLEYALFANGKLIDAQLRSDNFPVATLPSSNIEISSKYSLDGDVSSKIEAELKLESETELFMGLSGIAEVDVSGDNLFNCIETKCIFSAFSLNYGLTADQDRLGGFFACRRLPCTDTDVHEILTKNTASFIESAAELRIFNPIFLAFIYRTLSAGEKVGDGHSVKF